MHGDRAFPPATQFGVPRCGADHVEACLRGFYCVTSMPSWHRDRVPAAAVSRHLYASDRGRADGAAACGKPHVSHIDNKRP